jgi:LuxR family maltose regulon positive regulatory protein
LVLSLARIWIDRRAFPLVSSWLEEIDSERDSWVRTFGDINHRMLAIDLALAMGDPGEAAAMAEYMTGVAEASSRWAEYVGFASRWAVCLDRLGYRQRATMQFDAALSRGVAGGFLQSLAVPGVDTTTLFANQWKGSPERLAARRSLSASAVASQQCHHGMLSARELEVLSMVAAGRSNQDIAARLFISRNTVRNHLVNISRRLDVHSRSEAVARARELELIR